MKICFLCNEYPPARHGGIGSATRTLGRALVEAGHEVRVLGLDSTDASLRRVEVDHGVKVWRQRTPKSFLGWIRSRHSLYRTVLAWAQSRAIDILETPDYQGFAAAWPGLCVPIVTRLHGSASYFAAEMGKKPDRPSFLLERASLQRSDFLSSCSRYTAERTRQLFRLRSREIRVLYNPVTVAPHTPDSPRNCDQVIFSGTLTPKKGIISLIRAWPLVLERRPRAQLHVFGKAGRTDTGAPMESFLISCLPFNVRHTVHFYGHVDSRRLRSAFQTSTVAVFPSYAEAFALAPMEAMAEACPTIYSRRASGTELIQHEQNGLLTDPDDPPDIASKIVQVLDNPVLASVLGEAGRKHVESHFSLPALLPQNVDFYRDCIRSFRDRHLARAKTAPRAARESMRSPTQDLGEPTQDATPLRGWRIAQPRPAGLSDCSLIVATFKRPTEAKTLVAALAALPDAPNEVVIVDGSPSDATERALLDLSANLRLPFELIYVRSPNGLTRQRNVGVDVSSKSVLFFLDDDALPMDKYFDELARVLREDSDRRVGAVGACIVNEIDKPISRRWQIRRAIGLVPRSEPFIYNDVGTSAPVGLLRPFSGTREVDIFPGGACAIRREVFNSMRFSDFFAGYSWGEDVEMSLRIRRYWRVLCCGDARVYHRGLESTGGRPASFTRGQMEVRNRYFIWKRYSAETTLLNRIRFHLDLLFLFALDLAWFVFRPWQGQHFSHAFGVLSGLASCVVSPPRCAEPAALVRYRLEANEAPDGRHQYQTQAV
jgi:glycogen synthase